jgi:hypothetical protein
MKMTGINTAFAKVGIQFPNQMKTQTMTDRRSNLAINPLEWALNNQIFNWHPLKLPNVAHRRTPSHLGNPRVGGR